MPARLCWIAWLRLVVVLPYTGEPMSLNDGEVAAFLGREGIARQDNANSVVEKIIVNTVSDIIASCQRWVSRRTSGRPSLSWKSNWKNLISRYVCRKLVCLS